MPKIFEEYVSPMGSMYEGMGYASTIKWNLKHTNIIPGTFTARGEIAHWVLDPKYGCDPAYPRVGKITKGSFYQLADWSFQMDEIFLSVNLNHLTGVVTVVMNCNLPQKFMLYASYEYSTELYYRTIDDTWES